MSGFHPTARDVAVLALGDRAGNVSAHLARLLDRHGLSGEDRSLAGELALGVCRRRLTLRTIVGAFLAQPDRKLPASLNEILAVSLYQVLFMSRVPDFAAVNEAVDQTIRFHHKRKSGMVNGILRTVLRNLSPAVSGPPPYAGNIVPIAPDAYRMTLKDVFPDPSADPAGYLSKAFSLPMSLAGRWIERFGSLGKAATLAMHANVRAPIILRVNTLKSDVPAVLEKLASANVGASAHENGRSVVLARHTLVTELPGFDEGLMQPQDPTATAVSVAAAPAAGMRVLDFCAAPGTKTTHLAELMGNRGSITAVDVSREKLQRLEDNCRRMGVDIVSTHLADDIGGLEPQGYDLVLADVPCSNTGVLARRAEARWRFEQTAIGEMVKDQEFLLTAAANFVRPGGRLVYSTCSLESEENEQLAHWFQKRQGRFKLANEKQTLPGGAENPAGWHDGGYFAIFQA